MKLTFNNCSTLFKCDPPLFSIIEYSKNYRQQLIEKIIYFRKHHRIRDFI